jgi:hypothetical protein
MPCVALMQDGDDGVNVVFHVEHFAEVAHVMKPKRRRELSPEKRHQQIERLQEYRFRRAA